MARNGSGTYSVLNTFVAGATITAAGHNQNWSDIGAEITNSLALDGQSTMTGQLKAASGTESAPSYTFGSDTDTGLWRIGANNLGIGVAGAKVIDVAAAAVAITGSLSVSTTSTFTGVSTFTAAPVFSAGGGLGTGTFTGNATLSGDLVLSGLCNFSGTSHVKVPVGTTAQAPAAGTAGRLRFNSTTTRLTVDDGSSHVALLNASDASAAAAVKAETAETTFIQPDRLKNSPRVPKVICQISYPGGTPTLTAGSVGVSSLTDTGAGQTTINFSTAFANTNYVVQASQGASSQSLDVSSLSTGSCLIITRNSGGSVSDPTLLFVTIWGEQ